MLAAVNRLKNHREYSDLSMSAYSRELDGFTITRALAAFQRTLLSNGSRYDAFAKGDKDTLRRLLAKDVYETFEQAISARKDADTITESTLVSVKAKDIKEAQLSGKKARLTVTFDTEQVSLTKDKNGTIVGGDASQTAMMDDEWIFERDVSSANPNWTVIET